MSVLSGIRRRRPRPAVSPDGRMPLTEHLRELRYRLVVSVAAIAVAFAVAYVLRAPLLDLFTRPYCGTESVRMLGEGCTLASFTPTDQLQAVLRVCTTAAVVAAAPVWLYQLGRFVTPALHPHERRMAALFAAASAVLFVGGVVFAYLVLSRALDVLLDLFGGQVSAVQGVIPYLRFVTLVLLAFGAAFEFPVVVMFFHLLGLLPVERMRAWRRGVVFALAVFTAVVTPTTDPVTFLAMLVPLWLMYEACIVLATLHERRVRRRRAAEGLEDLDDDATSPLDERVEPVGVSRLDETPRRAEDPDGSGTGR